MLREGGDHTGGLLSAHGHYDRWYWVPKKQLWKGSTILEIGNFGRIVVPLDFAKRELPNPADREEW